MFSDLSLTKFILVRDLEFSIDIFWAVVWLFVVSSFIFI